MSVPLIMKNLKAINLHQVNNLNNKIKIITLNLYLDKKEEILDLKSVKIKDNSFIILILIKLNLKVHHGSFRNNKNMAINNLLSMNFVKSIL
jgi:hypothetical protein